ncbi:BTAD domain-containing putative transcriptional regulator [Kribbella sp. NPDC056951]|uniref:AfsR/SARP family transcriptional regulator n=1 Tax=Kribbella sp. NPDC056951 TaxID=3345978 RepID=UPI00363EF4C3
MAEIRLLGAVEVWADGVELDIGSAKPRMVLAALAVAAGDVVPTAVIADRVWGGRPPKQPAATLYPYVSLLRNALRPVGIEIVRRGGGYVLEADDEVVDSVRLLRVLAEARAGRARIDELGEALALWRGVPLAGMDSCWSTAYRAELSSARLSAWLLLAEQADHAGQLSGLADGLAGLVGDFPLSEPLSGYLIRSLTQAGRRAEALQQYVELRERLVAELGEEPGDELQELHLSVLRRDPIGRAQEVPRQLPSTTRHFVGRAVQLEALDRLLAGGDWVCAIAGTAGIGKTTLALHWAHRVVARFPDGQLFVDLHGFDPSCTPTDPADAVRACLDALGIHPTRVPEGLEAQTALFRSIVAGRRLLIVLDNARNVEQVRPLIPAAPGCVVVVTSRNLLTGLVAELGAHAMTLDLLSPAEAKALLSDRIGLGRVDAEPVAAATLAERCHFLPLALSVCAAEAAHAPDRPLASLADHLTDDSNRLDRLDTADPMTSVRTVLSWSYAAQDPAERRLFRLLGLHPGPEISLAAAVSLAGATPTETAQQLRRLCQATLLNSPAHDRYAHHDLLRAYAAEVVVAGESHAARRRLVDHYLHTAYRAVGQLNPGRDEYTLGAPGPDVELEDIKDVEQALAWFAAELAVLVRVIDLAASAGLWARCWQLADLTATYLGRQGRWRDALAIIRVGLSSAQLLNDPTALGLAHRGVAYCSARTGDYVEGRHHLRRALEQTRATGCRLRLAYVLGIGGFVAARGDRYALALGYAENALALFVAQGSRRGQLRTLETISWYLARLGRLDDATTYARAALRFADELGDGKSAAGVHATLGYLSQRDRRHDEAARAYQHAVQLSRRHGDRPYLANALQSLGEVHADLGAARAAKAEALRIFEELDHPQAESLRAELDSS